jgi:hypothetical protein
MIGQYTLLWSSVSVVTASVIGMKEATAVNLRDPSEFFVGLITARTTTANCEANEVPVVGSMTVDAVEISVLNVSKAVDTLVGLLTSAETLSTTVVGGVVVSPEVAVHVEGFSLYNSEVRDSKSEEGEIHLL